MARKPINRNRPDDATKPHFEFCVHGRPVSAQTENLILLGVWKAKIIEACRAEWPATRQVLTCDVELRVTHYSERRTADRDNLLKPMQDALQGLVYVNDRQVRGATSNWRNIDGSFVVRHVSLPVARAFSLGEEFMHVRVWISPDAEDLG